MDQNEVEDARSYKKTLDNISPSFCTVKWRHATINFSSGFVKSCCHLPFRPWQPENLKNSKQLHETDADQQERTQMLNGVRPDNCRDCFTVEDHGHLSDRILWSHKPWMKFAKNSEIDKFTEYAKNPKWIELTFSNVCNMMCSYCSPIFSTKWLQEIREHGPYPLDKPHNSLDGLQKFDFNEKFDPQPLLEQFWSWFKTIYSDLNLVKITGGEPLLSPDTFKMMEWLIENPNPELTLGVNSNLSVKKELWNKFLLLAESLKDNNSLHALYLHPSLDSFGKRAEYIRYGLNFQLFDSNLRAFLDKQLGNVVITCTLNNLSLGGILDFWKYVLGLKRIYGKEGCWISVSFEPLHAPYWQSIRILPPSFRRYLEEVLIFMHQNKGPSETAFSDLEILGVERALDLMKAGSSTADYEKNRFIQFFDEHDRRRGTNLRSTFPEILPWINNSL